jgi:hypothetical protein
MLYSQSGKLRARTSAAKPPRRPMMRMIAARRTLVLNIIVNADFLAGKLDTTVGVVMGVRGDWP